MDESTAVADSPTEHDTGQTSAAGQTGGQGAVGRRGTRIGGESRQQLAKQVSSRYSSGESIREIAADLNRSYGFVHRLLTESDTALRGRGGATRRKSSS